METIRILLEQERKEEADRTYGDVIGNENWGTFIARLTKNNEYTEYCTTHGEDKENHVEKKMVELESLSSSHREMTRSALKPEPFGIFVAWFNEFSEHVAEELS